MRIKFSSSPARIAVKGGKEIYLFDSSRYAGLGK